MPDGGMVQYRVLGFRSFESYREQFFKSLLSTNKTYAYFVDWQKAEEAVQNYEDELALLNTLHRAEPEERAAKLRRLLKAYPQVVEVLPLLIAERGRAGKIDILDPETERYLELAFTRERCTPKTISEIIRFCEKTGILALFDRVTDLQDYLLGVEVGLDTNARKNRSGKVFEDMCLQKIRRIVGKRYKLVGNDPQFSLYEAVADPRARGKRHDAVIYRGKVPVLVVEFNFYNTPGSKPTSIAESYEEMARAAKEQGVKFLWVTDGPAWHKMRQPLLRAMRTMDWILNYRLLDRLPRILR